VFQNVRGKYEIELIIFEYAGKTVRIASDVRDPGQLQFFPYPAEIQVAGYELVAMTGEKPGLESISCSNLKARSE
jgi:hypothetical protein